ncbi:unnamed protein product [Prorocentrum cordatum]|uniref:Uncharacterized protein n=1 Tax=Prorocentrum cordatum TaxID=2364126 RepID=A0ABN9URQ8_9DINO|nr:unnamed protein product [Polarella glacialis]
MPSLRASELGGAHGGRRGPRGRLLGHSSRHPVGDRRGAPLLGGGPGRADPARQGLRRGEADVGGVRRRQVGDLRDAVGDDGIVVWDGDLYGRQSFTRVLDKLFCSVEVTALAFYGRPGQKDFEESWRSRLPGHRGSMHLALLDGLGWPDVLPEQPLPEERWDDIVFRLGREALRATGAARVFSIGGGSCAVREARAAEEDGRLGAAWRVYRVPRGDSRADFGALAEWALEWAPGRVELWEPGGARGRFAPRPRGGGAAGGKQAPPSTTPRHLASRRSRDRSFSVFGLSGLFLRPRGRQLTTRDEEPVPGKRSRGRRSVPRKIKAPPVWAQYDRDGCGNSGDDGRRQLMATSVLCRDRCHCRRGSCSLGWGPTPICSTPFGRPADGCERVVTTAGHVYDQPPARCQHEGLG